MIVLSQSAICFLEKILGREVIIWGAQNFCLALESKRLSYVMWVAAGTATPPFLQVQSWRSRAKEELLHHTGQNSVMEGHDGSRSPLLGQGQDDRGLSIISMCLTLSLRTGNITGFPESPGRGMFTVGRDIGARIERSTRQLTSHTWPLRQLPKGHRVINVKPQGSPGSTC